MREKVRNYAVISIIFVAYTIYAAGLFLQVGIDSDYSNLVLEANDILSGNVFLSGWNLTGISFITTDLPYFVFGALFSGISAGTYYIAIIAMYIVLVFSALLLLRQNGKALGIVETAVFLAVGGFPTVYACSVLRAHTAAASLIFFALFTFECYKKNQKSLPLIAGAVFVALATCGDSLALIIGVVPIIIYCARFLFTGGKIHRRNMFILLSAISGTILGVILESVYIGIGDTNKNSFLKERLFVTAAEMPQKISLLLEILLGVNGADFFGKPIVALSTLIYFIRTVLIILVAYVIFRSIKAFIFSRNCDFICFVLSAGAVITLVILSVTTIIADAQSGRYIGYFPIMSAVLVIRYFSINPPDLLRKRLSFPIVTAVSILICALSFIPPSYSATEGPQYELAHFLEESGLENGYAQFWHASHTTVASENRVKVRAAIYDRQEHICGFNWFCKDEWYSPEYANYIVIENSDPDDVSFGITQKNVLKCLGKPSKRLTCGNYTIFVYNRNIAKEILLIKS